MCSHDEKYGMTSFDRNEFTLPTKKPFGCCFCCYGNHNNTKIVLLWYLLEVQRALASYERFDEPRHDACASLCRTTQKCKTLVPDEYVRFFGLFCVNKWVELATLFNPFESRSFCRWFAHSFRLICMIFRKQLTHTHTALPAVCSNCVVFLFKITLLSGFSYVKLFCIQSACFDDDYFLFSTDLFACFTKTMIIIITMVVLLNHCDWLKFQKAP